MKDLFVKGAALWSRIKGGVLAFIALNVLVLFGYLGHVLYQDHQMVRLMIKYAHTHKAPAAAGAPTPTPAPTLAR